MRGYHAKNSLVPKKCRGSHNKNSILLDYESTETLIVLFDHFVLFLLLANM